MLLKHHFDNTEVNLALEVFLREGRLSSKSEAAEWAYANAQGAWKKHLPQARQVRLNPWMANLAETKRWLNDLDAPTNQACDEMEAMLGG